LSELCRAIVRNYPNTSFDGILLLKSPEYYLLLRYYGITFANHIFDVAGMVFKRTLIASPQRQSALSGKHECLIWWNTFPPLKNLRHPDDAAPYIQRHGRAKKVTPGLSFQAIIGAIYSFSVASMTIS
jgi:hypothetical protein